MEVFYYFKNPQILIKHIHDSWIKNDGKLIMGIDHYYENEECHEWKKKINVDTMELIKIEEWKNFKNLWWPHDIKDNPIFSQLI